MAHHSTRSTRSYEHLQGRRAEHKKALALQDFPVEPLHLVGNWCGFGAKPAIAVQVKGDVLEQVPQVVDAKAAALEHLDLVVEPLDKAAALVMPEGVGDAIQPRRRAATPPPPPSHRAPTYRYRPYESGGGHWLGCLRATCARSRSSDQGGRRGVVIRRWDAARSRLRRNPDGPS